MREYKDNGILSKDAGLYVYDDKLSKYVLLLPVKSMPASKSAPATVDNIVLSQHTIGEVEGLQKAEQKPYKFNFKRDHVRALKKVKGKTKKYLEINPDMTGEMFEGKLNYTRDGVEGNNLVEGQFYITVSSSNEDTVDDVRDLIANTAIIVSPLNDLTIKGTAKVEFEVETNPADATVTAKSESDSIATVAVEGKKVTVTGVTSGFTIIELTTAKVSEASGVTTFMVEIN